MIPTFAVYSKDDWPLCVGDYQEVIKYLGISYKRLYWLISATKGHYHPNMKIKVYKYKED